MILLTDPAFNSAPESEGTTPPFRLLSFVNHHYGPLRGLSFVVEGQACEDVDLYLKNQPGSIIEKIWEATLISSRVMEFPLLFLTDLEQEPPRVKSIEEGEKLILERVRQGMNSGDPFYFRSFIY